MPIELNPISIKFNKTILQNLLRAALNSVKNWKIAGYK